MRVLAFVAAVAASASAAPARIDPEALPEIAVSDGGHGPLMIMFSMGVDVADVLATVPQFDFMMIAHQKRIEGRIGRSNGIRPATADRLVETLAAGLTVLRPGVSDASFTLEYGVVDPIDLVRSLASTAKRDFVVVARHPMPQLAIVMHRRDPHELAQLAAKLAGLEMIETASVWLFVEPGTKLDPKQLAKTDATAKLAIDRARVGEVRRLLDPALAPADDICPGGVLVSASIHGEVGAVEAAIAALQGPPCVVPKGALDVAKAKPIATFAGKRAVVRTDHGSASVEASSVGEGWIDVAGHRSFVHAYEPPLDPKVREASGPFGTDAAAHWKLRATTAIVNWLLDGAAPADLDVTAILVSDHGEVRFDARATGVLENPQDRGVSYVSHRKRRYDLTR